MAGAMLSQPQMDRIARTIHVGGIGGLGDEIKETDLADFFGQHGEVTAVRISGRFAWIEFADVRAANAALGLDGESTGGHHLRVSQSKSAIHSNGLKRPPQRPPGGMPGVGDGMDSLTPEQRAAALQNLYSGYGAPGAAPGAPGGFGGGGYGGPQQQYGGYAAYGHQAYGGYAQPQGYGGYAQAPWPQQQWPQQGYAYPQQQQWPQQGYPYAPPPQGQPAYPPQPPGPSAAAQYPPAPGGPPPPAQ